MYYEEKMINGVLHWRGTPDGDFEPYTLNDLSVMYLDMKDQRNNLLGRIKGVRRAINP